VAESSACPALTDSLFFLANNRGLSLDISASLPGARLVRECTRTWHCIKMPSCIEQSNDLAPLSPFRFWLDCITNTSGYDFGNEIWRARTQRTSKFLTPKRTSRVQCKCLPLLLKLWL
jgi:hypothetical protein